MRLRNLSDLSKKHIPFLVMTAAVTALLLNIIPDQYKIQLSLIILAIVFFGAVALRNFFQGLCILIFINPLLFFVEIGRDFPISLQGVVSIVIIVMGASYFLPTGLSKRKREFPAVKPFILILFFSSFSLFYSSDVPSLSVKFGRFVSYLSLYVLLVANLESWERIRSLIRVVYLSYLAPILIAIPQFFGLFSLEADPLELEKIGIMSKNTFGITVAMLALFLVGWKVLGNKSLVKLIRTKII
jgi:hypothetical protein